MWSVDIHKIQPLLARIVGIGWRREFRTRQWMLKIPYGAEAFSYDSFSMWTYY
jgi:hypothetical protein